MQKITKSLLVKFLFSCPSVHFTVEMRKKNFFGKLKGRMCYKMKILHSIPADMKTVEEQFEDTPRDMECYRDADGNVYDFAYGLNWSGVIDDDRVKKYR